MAPKCLDKSPFAKHASLLRGEVERLIALEVPDPRFRVIIRLALRQPGHSLDEQHTQIWPILPLLVCEAICGYYEKAVTAAAAIDFFWTSADIFDDIEDKEGEDVWWQELGIPVALNAATSLLALGHLAIARLENQTNPRSAYPLMRMVNTSILQSSLGQHNDLTFEHVKRISQRVYLKMVRQKSATLLECACSLGAWLAGGTKKYVKPYANFGRYLGMAAQIKNDAMALKSDLAAKRDIERRKKTLPIIYALANARGDARRMLVEIYSTSGSLSLELRERVRQILISSGAVHYSLTVAELYRLKALKALEHPNLGSHNTKNLILFVHL